MCFCRRMKASTPRFASNVPPRCSSKQHPGTLAPTARWDGLWECGPFDITEGGYVDTSGIAVGTWHVEPLP
jgi:hypothetical protein